MVMPGGTRPSKEPIPGRQHPGRILGRGEGGEEEEEEEVREPLVDSPVMKTVVAMSASASMGCTTAWKSSSARPAPLCGFSSTSARQGRGSTP